MGGPLWPPKTNIAFGCTKFLFSLQQKDLISNWLAMLQPLGMIHQPEIKVICHKSKGSFVLPKDEQVIWQAAMHF